VPRFIIFYVSFVAVVISIVAIVLRFSNTLLFLISFLFFVIGVRIALWWVTSNSPFDRVEFNIVEDDEAGHILMYIVRNGIQVSAINFGVLAIVYIQGTISVENVLQFQFTRPWLAILIGICTGAALGGALYIVVGMSGLFIRAMIPRLERWIESHEDLEEDEVELLTAVTRSLTGRSEENEEGR
jgi:hypothetical protein